MSDLFFEIKNNLQAVADFQCNDSKFDGSRYRASMSIDPWYVYLYSE